MGRRLRPIPSRRSTMRSLRLWVAREFNGGHTAKEWREMLAEFDHRCVRCERKGGFMSKDHIIPVAMGGMDTIDNIQPLCRKCNRTKGSETTDWKAYRRAHGWSSVAPARAFAKR